MSKKIFAILALATIVFASSALVLAEEISSSEAEKIASEYASEGEYTETKVGLLYHSDKPYHVVGFFEETTDEYTGSVIVDALSGEIVKDEDTAREIFYTVVCYFDLGMGTPEALASTMGSIALFQSGATDFEVDAKNFTERAKKPGTSSKLKGALKDAASSYEALGNDCLKMANIAQECYDLGKQWQEKKDTKITKGIVSKNDELGSYIYASFMPNLKNANDSINTLYDTMISETTDPTEKASLEMEKEFRVGILSLMKLMLIWPDIWEGQKTAIIEGSDDVHGVDWEVEKMGDRIVSFEALGFGAIFAITELLAVAYLFKRKK